MTEKLTYKDLILPTFVNSHPALSVTSHKEGESNAETITLPFSDIPIAAVLSGISFLGVGDTRCGKSQLMMDIHRNYFGGDADEGGRSNWNVARNDFKSDTYFMTIDQNKIGEGRGNLSEAKVPIMPRVKALSNIVDELNLAIPEIQVEFFGMAEGRHKGMQLGDNYHLFMASCNMNRINGDFAGTSEINRALLNRFGVTFDFDYFKRTDEDDDILSERDVAGRLKLEPVRDISDKILEAHQEIREAASQRDPWIDAYLRLFSSGLEYCHIDKDKKKKKIWPMRCGDCSFANKDLCSLVKQMNTGTSGLLKSFVSGLNYLIQLKHSNVSPDPFDLVSEAYKFTTYHGNLNGIETNSTYNGEDQEQIRDIVSKIREKINPVKIYIDKAIAAAYEEGIYETRFIEIDVSGQRSQGEIHSEALIKKLQELKKSNKSIRYEVVQPFDNFGEKTGIRFDWFDSYLKSVAGHYHPDKFKS